MSSRRATMTSMPLAADPTTWWFRSTMTSLHPQSWLQPSRASSARDLHADEGSSDSAIGERGMLRIDSMMANFVKSEPPKESDVEVFVFEPRPSACPRTRRQRVQ